MISKIWKLEVLGNQVESSPHVSRLGRQACHTNINNMEVVHDSFWELSH